jgi:hypothetical protein
MCGSCCKALCVPISPQEARRYVLHNFPFYDWNEWSTYSNDLIFIDQELKPITYEHAMKINPEMDRDKEDGYFYSCPHLTEDNKCGIHDQLEKGHMCDGFPWYGGKPHGSKWYHPNCGYNVDVKEAAK